jgi:hypothetical protein
MFLSCRAVVMLNSHNIEHGTVLRSFVPREDAGENPLITEVFHSTCATTGLLPPIIVRGTSSREFGQRLLPGTLHLNNPVKFARPELEKAYRRSGSDTKPEAKAIISIGTQPLHWDPNEDRHKWRAKLWSILNVLFGRSIETVPVVADLNRVSNGTDHAHNDMMKDYPRDTGIYHRLLCPRYEPVYPSFRSSLIATKVRLFYAGTVGLGLLWVSHALFDCLCSTIADNVFVPDSLTQSSSWLYNLWFVRPPVRWLVRPIFWFCVRVIVSLPALYHSGYLYDQVNELDPIRQKILRDRIKR